MDFEPNDQAFETDEEQTDDSDYDSNEQADGSEATEDVKKPTKKKGEQGICVKCNKKKKIQSRSMCESCYEKDLKIKHESEGRMTANLVTCVKCNQLRKHRARGLCNACYSSVLYSNQLEHYPKTRSKSHNGLKAVCIKCKKTKRIERSSMCWTCYKSDLKARRETGEKNCANCKRLKQLETNGFCSQCNLNNVKSEENALDQESETNSNASDQKLKTNLNALDQELETNSNDTKERLTSKFLVVRSDFVKSIELVSNPVTFEIETQDKKVINENSSVSQLKENIDQTALTSPLIFNPEKKRSISFKYSMTDKDFIEKLKQHTRSKLKPSKKKQIMLSAKESTETKQPNLNVTKKKDHVSEPKSIQLAKKSSKTSFFKGPIAPIRLTKTLSKSSISKGPIAPIRLTKMSSKSASQTVKRSLKTLLIEAQSEEKTANQINKDLQQMKPHYARNLCSVCYQRFMTEKNKKEDTATKANATQTGRKQFFVKPSNTNQESNVTQYELLFGTSRKRKLEQSDNENFSDDEFYSMF